MEYYNRTTIHPLALIILIALSIATLFLPRKYAFIPLIFIGCFISPAQRFVIGGLDFTMIRIIVVFAWIRIIKNKELVDKLLKIDKIVICYSIVSIVAYTLLMSFSTFVYSMGTAFDILGIYFFARSVIKSEEDIVKIIKAFIFISIPVAFFFIIEHQTGRNIFSIFGGVPEFTAIREGKLRCTGAFAHPILAGGFWATIVPLIFSIAWYKKNNKIISIIGIVCSIIIIIMCASSTPIASLALGCVGMLFYFFRKRLRTTKIVIIILLLLLQIVMKNPLYFLVMKMDLTGGSTSYFRYLLIDKFFEYWRDWLLIGVRDTYYWNQGTGLASIGLRDVTNQFILEAVRGGVLRMVLFSYIFLLAYKYLGKIIKFKEDNKAARILLWGIGVSIFVHNANFIGVSYFGQIIIIWWMVLGICGSLFEKYGPEINKQDLNKNSPDAAIPGIN